MEKPFPSWFCDRIFEASGSTRAATSGMDERQIQRLLWRACETLARHLDTDKTVIWRAYQSLERGVLPEKTVVIGLCWALGASAGQQSYVAQQYDYARKHYPKRRSGITEHHTSVAAPAVQQCTATHQLPTTDTLPHPAPDMIERLRQLTQQ